MISLIKKILRVIKKRNPLKYAKSIGVNISDDCRLVDNPLWGTEPYLITIGKHVLISGKVTFLTHDGATHLFREQGPYKDTLKYGTINIGNNCFIGHGSTILPNITIGNDCIIATGAVVTKSIPDGEVWGGVPAKFICKTDDFAKKCYSNRIQFDMDNLKKNKKDELIKHFKVNHNKNNG